MPTQKYSICFRWKKKTGTMMMFTEIKKETGYTLKMKYIRLFTGCKIITDCHMVMI